MNRNQRAAYLQAMGIESWLPIKALPNAQTGHWVSNPAVFKSSIAANSSSSSSSNSIVESESQSVTAQNIVNRSLALAEQFNIDTPVKTTTHSPPKAIPSKPVDTVAVSAADQSFDNFTLSATVWADVLIIDDITAMNFASSAYQHWLNAILLSLGKKIVSDTANVQDRFDWPLADSGIFDTSQQAAKEIFSAWLQRKLDDNNARWVLLMGNAAVAMHNRNADLGFVTSLHESQDGQAIQVLSTYGSGELWRQPLLKRDFWQHIQPLRSTANAADDATNSSNA